MNKVYLFLLPLLTLSFLTFSQKINNNQEIKVFIYNYTNISIDSLIKRHDSKGYQLFIINIAKLDTENKIVSFSIGSISSEGELDDVKATHYIIVKGRLVLVKSMKLKNELSSELKFPLIDSSLTKEIKKGLLYGIGNGGYPISFIVNYVNGKVVWGYKVIKGVSINDYIIQEYPTLMESIKNNTMQYDSTMFKDTLI